MDKPKSIEKYDNELDNLCNASEEGMKTSIANRRKIIAYTRELEEFIQYQQQEIERLNKWIYDQGIKLDGIIPLIGMTNSERVEKAIDWLDHHGKPEIGE